MTDAEKLQAVEEALDGHAELLAGVRNLRGTFEYSARDCWGDSVPNSPPVPTSFDEMQGRLWGLLDWDECDLLDRAVSVLGQEKVLQLYLKVLAEPRSQALRADRKAKYGPQMPSQRTEEVKP